MHIVVRRTRVERRSLRDRAQWSHTCVLDRSTSCTVGPLRYAIGGHPVTKLPPPSPDVIIARVLPPFPFLEILRSVAPARSRMYISTYLYASHDIPRVRVSYGTVHNSRVSGRTGLSRYQGRVAIGNATLVKTEIPRTSLKRKRSDRWISRWHHRRHEIRWLSDKRRRMIRIVMITIRGRECEREGDTGEKNLRLDIIEDRDEDSKSLFAVLNPTYELKRDFRKISKSPWWFLSREPLFNLYVGFCAFSAKSFNQKLNIKFRFW